MDGAIARAVAAYGGAERWTEAERATIRFDAGGLLFKLKRRPPQTDVAVTVWTGEEQHVEVELGDGKTGILEGGDVSVRDRSGQTIGQRADARANFSGLRGKTGRWDDLDFTYFAGSAWWTYLLGPINWLRPDVDATVIDGHTVDVTYGPSLATHCRRQRFHLNDDGLIVRHDYTAEVLSGLARANHRSSDFHEHDGIRLATTRRVTPARLPGPVLVALDVRSFHLGAT